MLRQIQANPAFAFAKRVFNHEISQKSLKTNQLNILHTFRTNASDIAANTMQKQKPENPAFFTGNPNYYTIDKICNDFSREIGVLGQESTERAQNAWMTIQEMEKMHNMKLNQAIYQSLIKKLSVLKPFYSQHPRLNSFLKKFVRAGSALQNKKQQLQSLDEYGRSYTIASRMSAKAQAWMIAGEGKVYVNGKPLSEYFDDKNSKLNAIRALVMTNQLAKYNVWALVENGGTKSQSEAISVAVARALAIHDNQWTEKLQELGMTRIDTRQRERKKTNQPGARTKYRWTKR